MKFLYFVEYSDVEFTTWNMEFLYFKYKTQGHYS